MKALSPMSFVGNESEERAALAVPQRAARGGSIDRRAFLKRGMTLTGAVFAGGLTSTPAGHAAEPIVPGAFPWQLKPGEPFRGYGQPSRFQEPVKRTIFQPFGATAPGAGASFTPLQSLNGTITANGLHFERHHNGVPDIDPAQHRLLIHGMVKRPLFFTVQALQRYPMTSRICFIECGGNSFRNTLPEPPQVTCGMIHGLLSCSEWTGVPLAMLLDEAGFDPKAKWVLAEGADSASMSRSVPMEKVLDDALIALYQNGEAIRPEQGYPMRLLLPGWLGNISVKWLRRIKVTDGPTHTRDETSHYTDLMPDGKARQFTHVMEVKSVITYPSGGMTMQGPGFYEITGLAWSGRGRIVRVETSVDGGENWAEAALQAPVLPQSLTRFRLPWKWDGSPAMLQSRATDDKGDVQETHKAWADHYSPANRYHCNAIQTWGVTAEGSIRNVYL
jgi:sulfane dehydrogenase subunit SoxC